MADRKEQQVQLLHAGIGAAIVFFVSYAVAPLLPVVPNAALVAAIAAAFFISDALVFGTYVLLLLLWIKYLPGITLEMAYLAGVAAVTYIVVRLLVLKKSFAAVLVFLALFQFVFWAFFFTGNSALGTVYFYLEFLYNGILALILFGAHAWIQRNYH